MSEILKIFLTSSLTIIGGVTVYALSQIVVGPIFEQRKIIGEIADALIFYANVYSSRIPGLTSKDKIDAASKRLRQLAALLQSKTHLIPWYGVFERLRIVHKSAAIEDASTALIGLSNSVGDSSPQSSERVRGDVNKIKERLNLRIT